MHIKELDIFRFIQELSTIDWSHENLVFLDEVSFDNRGMIRKCGNSLKGKTVAVRGDFQRKPRVSVLAFIGVHGIIDYYDTEGTFDRVMFLEPCRLFAYSKRGNVRQYPGPNSVWILDRSAIHRDSEIVRFLRSIRVVSIFLPAYCPFFNPIEYLFGYVKKAFQRHYDEASGRDITPFIAQTVTLFEGYGMANVFEHCGWSVQGYFNPVDQLAKEINTAPDAREGIGQMDAHQDELEFSIRQNELQS